MWLYWATETAIAKAIENSETTDFENETFAALRASDGYADRAAICDAKSQNSVEPKVSLSRALSLEPVFVAIEACVKQQEILLTHKNCEHFRCRRIGTLTDAERCSVLTRST